MKRPAQPVRFIIIVSVLAIVAYVALIWLLAPDELWGSISTFVATIISVIAAFFIGVALYNRQVREADASRRQQLSRVLVAELTETINALNDAMMYRVPLPDQPHSNAAPITYIQPIMLEDAARSGLFNATATGNMLSLARMVRLYNVRVSQLFSILAAQYPYATGNRHVLGYDYYHYQVDRTVRAISDYRKTIVAESEDLIIMIQTGEHAVAETIADVEEVEDKRPRYQQLIGW